MCWCTPANRTPCCGGVDCHPPLDRIEPRPAVIEGGLHVEMTVRGLLELAKQLPTVRAKRMGTFFLVSGKNTPQVADAMTATAAARAAGERPALLTHVNAGFAITDVELSIATDVGLENMLRTRAAAELARIKNLSPGCTEIHWIGPVRGGV